MSRSKETLIRDRVVELRRVKASTLLAHPDNWRKHPEAQKQVMTDILKRIGYAGALIGRVTPQGIQLLDGHLRADTTPNMTVPVLIVDLNDEEAKVVLATMDPIAAMAEKDNAMLTALLQEADLLEGEFAKWVATQKEPPLPTPISASEIPSTLSQAIQAHNQAEDRAAQPQAGNSNVQQPQVSPLANSAPPAPLVPPADFASFDEEIETAHECPRCHYRWS